MTVRLLLIDDHKMFRDGLRPLLQTEMDLEVIGEASDGLAAVEMAVKLAPDLIIMDISMPNLNGIEATRKILREVPDCQIIVLSMHSDRQFVLAALKAGAMGYLLKDSPYDDLIGAIRRVLAGEVALSEQIRNFVVRDYIKQAQHQEISAFTVLSMREREVLQLLAEGRSTKEIAAMLNVSAKTIETHRKQVMDKLEIRSIAELTKYAIREGLTPLD